MDNYNDLDFWDKLKFWKKNQTDNSGSSEKDKEIDEDEKNRQESENIRQRIIQTLAHVYAINNDEISVIQVKSLFLSDLEKISSDFELIGNMDGNIEVSPKIAKGFINSTAKNLQAYIKAVLQSKQSVSKTEKATKGDFLEIAEEDWQSQKTYLDSLVKQYRWNYKVFSLVMGLFYIAVAVLFLVADFPLSQLVTQQGFEIKSWEESILLSLGITFFGVYFKSWYDEFISYPLEKSVSQFKVNNLPEVNEDEIVKIRKTFRNRLILKTFILIFALTTIVVLGVFRFNMFLFINDIPRDSEAASTYAMLSFILIALMFPFFSGICASLGFDRIQNFIVIRKAQKLLDKKYKIYLLAKQQNERAIIEVETCQDYINWCSSESFIDDCVESFLSRYNRGYCIGITQSNLHKDYFEKAENMRRRMAGKKSFQITQTIVPE